MFPKSHRFSFRKGAPKRIYVSDFFVLRYDSNIDNLHCSVVVGKKVDKRAVIRNRLKRQILVILKELVPETTNFDIVIFTKKQMSSLTHDEITKELENALTKTQIIK